jgi:hypothetical protein
VRITRLVSHPVGELCQRRIDFMASLLIRDSLFERAAHAQQPRIAFPLANPEAQMPLAQARMALFSRIEFWSAHPFAKIALEHVLG